MPAIRGRGSPAGGSGRRGGEAASVDLPGKSAQFRAAGSAIPAAHALGPAMPVEQLAAVPAIGPPSAFGHVGLAAALRTGPYLQALALPDQVVPMPRTDEGMGDLVQDGVEDLLLPVPRDEVAGKLDRSALVDAEPHRLFPMIVGEAPAAQPVGGQQLQGPVADGIEAGLSRQLPQRRHEGCRGGGACGTDRPGTALVSGRAGIWLKRRRERTSLAHAVHAFQIDQ